MSSKIIFHDSDIKQAELRGAFILYQVDGIGYTIPVRGAAVVPYITKASDELKEREADIIGNVVRISLSQDGQEWHMSMSVKTYQTLVVLKGQAQSFIQGGIASISQRAARAVTGLKSCCGK